jgi:glycosyltransferase involved in cell wall biosynthesis
MNKFSIVIITFNEAANIGKCLESVKDLTDDIIVVDSGSTDETGNICHAYNTKFIYNKFQDYSLQKNFGNTLAKYDYIFSIDADEEVSQELKKSITSIDLSGNKAYSFNRLNFHSGKAIKHGGWYPDKKMRIWNKNYGAWNGTIHESVEFYELPEHISLKGNLLHYTYNNMEEHIRQAIKFSILNAQNDFEKGKKSSILKIIIAPFFRFFSIYILKLGFLDGYLGFAIAKTSAFASFIRYSTLKSVKKNEKKS